MQYVYDAISLYCSHVSEDSLSSLRKSSKINAIVALIAEKSVKGGHVIAVISIWICSFLWKMCRCLAIGCKAQSPNKANYILINNNNANLMKHQSNTSCQDTPTSS